MVIIKNKEMVKQKNTVNKKKHSRLMDQKKNKLKTSKELQKNKLKEIMRKANEQKERDNQA